MRTSPAWRITSSSPRATTTPTCGPLADELEEKLKGEGLPPARVEGYRSNSWILLDWGNVVIHIFTQEGRDFYDLDHLWADGKNVEWSPSLD